MKLKLSEHYRSGRLFWPILSTIGFSHNRPNRSHFIPWSKNVDICRKQQLALFILFKTCQKCCDVVCTQLHEVAGITETLRVELSTNWTDAGLSSLTLLQPSVQLLLQCDHIQPSCRSARHLLHPQLTTLRPFPAETVWLCDSGLKGKIVKLPITLSQLCNLKIGAFLRLP